MLPKPLLAQVGLDDQSTADMGIENGAIVLRRHAKAVRAGWSQVASHEDGALLMGEFGNAGDAELVW